jgi:hypothetical protein
LTSEILTNTITGVAAIVTIASLLWILLEIRRGRGFYTEFETPDGNFEKRLDLKLFMEAVITAFTFGGLYVLLLGNFACFIITTQWAFDPMVARGSLVIIMIVFSYYVLDHLYSFAKDKARKSVRIRKVKEGMEKEEGH